MAILTVMMVLFLVDRNWGLRNFRNLEFFWGGVLGARLFWFFFRGHFAIPGKVLGAFRSLSFWWETRLTLLPPVSYSEHASGVPTLYFRSLLTSFHLLPRLFLL